MVAVFGYGLIAGSLILCCAIVVTSTNFPYLKGNKCLPIDESRLVPRFQKLDMFFLLTEKIKKFLFNSNSFYF